MLLGTRYVLVDAIPPRFCNHAWLYVAVEKGQPSQMIAVRVFEDKGPFRHAIDMALELGTHPYVQDYIVPHLDSEIGERGLLYVYEKYCFDCLRTVASLHMETARNYLFQALFALHALQKEAHVVHGNIHRGNILFYHVPWIRGRKYQDGDDTWCVNSDYSVRFSDLSHSRTEEGNQSDLVALEVAFGKTHIREGTSQDKAMLADVFRQMRAQHPTHEIIRHDFFYKYRTFGGVDHFPHPSDSI